MGTKRPPEYEELKEVVTGVFRSILSVSADTCGTFRLLITANISGTAKPLLIVGNAHKHFEDGHAIAILNPDELLLGDVAAGTGYLPTNLLRQIVKDKCDAMLELWITTSTVADGARPYFARAFKPAKFSIR